MCTPGEDENPNSYHITDYREDRVGGFSPLEIVPGPMTPDGHIPIHLFDTGWRGPGTYHPEEEGFIRTLGCAHNLKELEVLAKKRAIMAGKEYANQKGYQFEDEVPKKDARAQSQPKCKEPIRSDEISDAALDCLAEARGKDKIQ